MVEKSIRYKAMDLLAMREHSRHELTNKLKQRGFELDEIVPCLNLLEQDNLLSDERFSQAYAKMRSRRGFGPLRIKQELQQRGVVDNLVESTLHNIDWLPLAVEAYAKKYRHERIMDFKERAKRMQFLCYRGYTQEQIKQVIGEE